MWPFKKQSIKAGGYLTQTDQDIRDLKLEIQRIDKTIEKIFKENNLSMQVYEALERLSSDFMDCRKHILAMADCLHLKFRKELRADIGYKTPMREVLIAEKEGRKK